jgi:site-specific DNA-methyltransferase (adenine-specific)
MSNIADAPAIAPCAIVGDASLYQADCRDVLRSLADNSIDSIVTDPPYALVSIVKRFGKLGSAPAKGNEAYQRASAGFMGKSWDTGEVAFSEEFWRECLRVLKPGGHVVAFSGTRTYHRMAVAIEDAGFEIRDQLGWLYGSGFPKSHDVAKQIDKSAGYWRGKAGSIKEKTVGQVAKGTEYERTEKGEPITDEAREWLGWGTALKPAWEPIALARKALSGTVAANVLSHGAGAISIDGTRIPASNEHEPNRWPANIVHDGSDEVLAAFPDNGASARFFYCAKASRKDRDEGLEGAQKATISDGPAIAADNAYQRGITLRANTHPTVKPTDLMRWLCRLVTPPGGVILDPFMGSGSTGKAALLEGFRFIGVEREDEYMPIAQARIAAALRPVAAKAQPANDNQPPVQASLFGDAA